MYALYTLTTEKPIWRIDRVSKHHPELAVACPAVTPLVAHATRYISHLIKKLDIACRQVP